MAEQAFTILANCVSTIQYWWSLAAQLIAEAACHHGSHTLVVSPVSFIPIATDLDDSETRKHVLKPEVIKVPSVLRVTLMALLSCH